jgi:hypothetical protein
MKNTAKHEQKKNSSPILNKSYDISYRKFVVRASYDKPLNSRRLAIIVRSIYDGRKCVFATNLTTAGGVS